MDYRGVLALAVLAWAWSGPVFADAADIETSYSRAAQQVQQHTKDFWLDENPQGARALERAWTLLADWTAAYLNEHPGATPTLLKHAAPGGALDVAPLGPRTMLVSAAVGNVFGTVFIVDGSEGVYRAVWSIRDRHGREAFPLLSAWTAHAAGQGCWQAKGDDEKRTLCGSLGGRILRLSDDAAHHPRFFVEASYSELAGMTQLDQMGLWTWTGTTAEPFLVSTFGANLEDDGPRFDGALLKVRLGESYRTMSPSWDHLDREIDWEFRLGPDGIEDLGKAPLLPEIDAVDELLFRAAHRQPMDDLAARDVQEAVVKIFGDEAVENSGDTYLLDMVGAPAVSRKDGKTLVCIPTDGPGNLNFTLTGSFVSGLAVTPDETGNGCPSDKP